MLNENQGLMMELEEGHRNSVLILHNAIEFWLIVSVMRTT